MKRLAISLVLLVSALAVGQESVIYSFKGNEDGLNPVAGLIADKAGNLYGTTEFGGTGSCVNGFTGCGTVFELSPDGQGGWAETVLYSFEGEKDGQWPLSGLILDAAGNLYGTTQIGGGTDHKCPPSCGSAFRLSPGGKGWTLTVLHAFKGGNDGGGPVGGLTADGSGNLYGVTYLGGTSNFGVFYQLFLSNGRWEFKKIHNFKNLEAGPDGGQPNGTPLYRVDGRIYGTTMHGGKSGGGVIYRFSLNKAGKWREKVVYSFGGGMNQGGEFCDLAQDAAGNLYGIGDGFGFGSHYAYQMSLVNGQWKRTNIHHFSESGGDGVPNPYLVIDASGNVFGTTHSGPSVPNGKVYKLSQGSWTEAVLYVFQGAPDGQFPESKLLIGAGGDLWGTTAEGGDGASCGGVPPGCGSVFKVAH